MRAFFTLLLATVFLASSPTFAKSHYSAAHTKKLVRMRQYPHHGKKKSAPKPPPRHKTRSRTRH